MSIKAFTSADTVSTRTLLHEVIPLTGTIVSGTYADSNIKNYTHGMFQSVYDYPYLSSSANHIFDITLGYSPTSVLSNSANTQNSKKINIYNQMSQVLMGFNVSGNIQEFDQDGDLSSGGSKLTECFFLSFARLLSKDEVKKGSLSLSLYRSGSSNSSLGGLVTISDYGAATDYRTNSPAGEYGVLYTSSADTGSAVGLVYYQTGIVVLTSSVFTGVFGARSSTLYTSSVSTFIASSSISSSCDGLRNRINNIQFNNTTELNSSIYFCRANHNEFNYSSNPTYVESSKIIVKNISTDAPVSYITTVGLYSADQELLAVAKLSEPLKKSVDNELTIRVRLDY